MNIMVLEMLDHACRLGHPVRVYAKVAGEAEVCAYDGWVFGSETPTSVTVCLGEQRFKFEWGEIEDVTFYTPLIERLTGAWLRDHL